MKIHVRLNFESSSSEILIRAICALPDEIRPTRHCEGELGLGKPIGNVEDYLALENRGSILRGSRVSYLVLGTVCDCEMDVDPNLSRAFLESMASATPVFGHAHTWDELKYRNWVFVEIDGGKLGTSEGFYGQDLSKYVPGLYWLTLLSEELAERHGVSLAEVEAVALEHVDLGDGQHLFRFFQDLNDWRERADVIDEFCARTSGMFDINHVRRLVEKGVRTFAERYDLLFPWS